MLKTKTSSKLNVLLMAIILLLLFVVCTRPLGVVGSWLRDSDEFGFTVNVSAINIEIKQDTRLISDGGQVYINATSGIIEGGQEYSFDSVTVSNPEEAAGYYIRFKAIAKVNGVEYNINEYINSDFYRSTTDGWMYYTADKGSETPIQLPKDDETTTAVDESLKMMINKFTIPTENADSSKLSTSKMQGKYFRLYIIVQGSATSNFSV